MNPQLLLQITITSKQEHGMFEPNPDLEGLMEFLLEHLTIMGMMDRFTFLTQGSRALLEPKTNSALKVIRELCELFEKRADHYLAEHIVNSCKLYQYRCKAFPVIPNELTPFVLPRDFELLGNNPAEYFSPYRTEFNPISLYH